MNYNLRIKPSQLPTAGLGVYADKQPFQCGQNIIEYTGERQPSNGNDYVYKSSAIHLSMLLVVAMLLALSMIVVLPIDMKGIVLEIMLNMF